MNDYIINNEEVKKMNKKRCKVSETEKIPGYNVPFPGANDLSDYEEDNKSDDMEIVLVSVKE